VRGRRALTPVFVTSLVAAFALVPLMLGRMNEQGILHRWRS